MFWWESDFCQIKREKIFSNWSFESCALDATRIQWHRKCRLVVLPWLTGHRRYLLPLVWTRYNTTTLVSNHTHEYKKLYCNTLSYHPHIALWLFWEMSIHWTLCLSPALFLCIFLFLATLKNGTMVYLSRIVFSASSRTFPFIEPVCCRLSGPCQTDSCTSVLFPAFLAFSACIGVQFTQHESSIQLEYNK